MQTSKTFALRTSFAPKTALAFLPLAFALASACTTDPDPETEDGGGAAGSGATGSTSGGAAGLGTGGAAGVGGASGGTAGTGTTGGVGGAASGGTAGTGTAGSGNAGRSGSGGAAGVGTAGTGGAGRSGAGGSPPVDSGTAGSAGKIDGGGTIDAPTTDGGGHKGPTPVDLGSTTNLAAPGSYVFLAKTGITNVTGSLITGGHLGLSPAAATFITGFSLIADATNEFATSVSVAAPSRVYASSYASPTPSNLTTAVLAMQAAYTDAAGRVTPDFLDLASGNLGGLTLVPGLYKWGTGVTVPSDVTISGAANDVWIFQIANDLDVTSAKNVILSGGAAARNIFWQVAGQATIHANAHFEGIILSQTGITLQTTASMHGRALAQTLIAIDNNAVTAP